MHGKHQLRNVTCYSALLLAFLKVGHRGKRGAVSLMYSSVPSSTFGTLTLGIKIVSGRALGRFAEMFGTTWNQLQICQQHTPRWSSTAANHH